MRPSFITVGQNSLKEPCESRRSPRPSGIDAMQIRDRQIVPATQHALLAAGRREYDPAIGQVTGLHVVGPVAVKARVLLQVGTRAGPILGDPRLHPRAAGSIAAVPYRPPPFRRCEIRRLGRLVVEHDPPGVEGQVVAIDDALAQRGGDRGDLAVGRRQDVESPAEAANPDNELVVVSGSSRTCIA